MPTTETKTRFMRIDHGNGEETELTTPDEKSKALRIIKEHYGNSEGVMQMFKNGCPARCTFATYELRSN